jgi:hypothetical protein
VFLVLGAVAVAAGLLLIAAGALGLGRLPGDFAFRGKHVRIYVPIATSILLSIVLTVVLNLIVRR